MSERSLSPIDRILELKDEAEKQKVELTPEVKAYIQAHLDIVQEKISKGAAVTEDDMKFIEEVRMWVEMSEDSRGELDTIEKMCDSEAMQEAMRRDITIGQWLDLVHFTEAVGNPLWTIDRSFEFPGKKKIIGDTQSNYDKDKLKHLPRNLSLPFGLHLERCPGLIHLPQGLEAESVTLTGCVNLVDLPEDLRVKKSLILKDCSSLIRLPFHDLHLEKHLNLHGCSSLVSLPDSMEIGGNFYLNGCTSLKLFPTHLRIGGDLTLFKTDIIDFLPDDLLIEGNVLANSELPPKSKQRIEQLKRDGKIKGGYQFI